MLPRFSIQHKKRENAEEAAAPMEIDNRGLRLLLLDDFHRCLEKSLVKNTRPFSTATHSADND
jgi:hypothetical protein